MMEAQIQVSHDPAWTLLSRGLLTELREPVFERLENYGNYAKMQVRAAAKETLTTFQRWGPLPTMTTI